MDTQTQTSMEHFLNTAELEMTNQRAPDNPHMAADDKWNKEARHWYCTFQKKFRPSPKLYVYFSQGSAHVKPPTAADVLDCLAMDSAGVEQARGFIEWASEYGYDTDSRKAEDIYDTCVAQARELREFLGEQHYELLLYHTERQ